MVAREKLKIPLLIGSAGTCGTDKSVDWFFEITKELAKELNQNIKVTLLKCSQSKKDISGAFPVPEGCYYTLAEFSGLFEFFIVFSPKNGLSRSLSTLSSP